MQWPMGAAGDRDSGRLEAASLRLVTTQRIIRRLCHAVPQRSRVALRGIASLTGLEPRHLRTGSLTGREPRGSSLSS